MGKRRGKARDQLFRLEQALLFSFGIAIPIPGILLRDMEQRGMSLTISLLKRDVSAREGI